MLKFKIQLKCMLKFKIKIIKIQKKKINKN